MARREGRPGGHGEERGGEEGQRTWSQPPGYSPLPGVEAAQNSWPSGPSPCAPALRKQPLPALQAARLRRPPRGGEDLLPQLAPPPLARPIPEPAEAAPPPRARRRGRPGAACPRAATRGAVGQARRRRGGWRGGVENSAAPGAGRAGRRARAGSGIACEDGRARHARSSPRCLLRPAERPFFAEPLPPPSTPRSVKVLWRAQAAILEGNFCYWDCRRISRRGGNTPLVAKVSSWTRRRTPEDRYEPERWHAGASKAAALV